jgi:HK97 family phage prohead protease
MEYSNLILNARDVDNKKGIVSFYFADFNSVDSQGRLMDRNAFNRTVKNNFQRFAHLLNHDTNLMIGKPLEVGTDNKGAFMVSQLSKNSAGRDALIMYEEGIITEHSFGFRIVNSVQEGKVEIVNELQMFEASSVTWGSNPATPTISLNSSQEDLFKEMRQLLERTNKNNKELLEVLNSIKSRLPATEEQHQAAISSEISEVMQLINDKY